MPGNKPPSCYLVHFLISLAEQAKILSLQSLPAAFLPYLPGAFTYVVLSLPILQSLTCPLTHCIYWVYCWSHPFPELYRRGHQLHEGATSVVLSDAVFAVPRTVSGVADTQCLLKHGGGRIVRSSDISIKKCLWIFSTPPTCFSGS